MTTKFSKTMMVSRLVVPLFTMLVVGCSSKIDFVEKPPPPPSVATELMITEISTAINTDANANGRRPHYVELCNTTGRAINLADYALGYMAIAPADSARLNPWAFGTNFFVLTGTLAVGKCYVIASPQLDAPVVKRDTVWGTTSSAAADASTPLQLSGNSAIALLKRDAGGAFNLGGRTYVILDVFGSPLVALTASKGSNSSRNNIIWTIAGETSDTRNRTFFRKKSVNGPSTDWQLSKGTTADNSQWSLSGDRAWDYTNVGKPTE